MVPETTRYFLLGLAAMARIEGMKWANQHRIDCGHSIAYDEDAFFAEAAALEQMAIDVINLGG